MNILGLLGIGLAAFLGYEWLKNQSLAASATVSTTNSGGANAVGSTPAQYLTADVQQKMLANAIKQGPAQGLTQYNAFGELLAPAWAWNNWMNQVVGQITDLSVYFSVPTQPISLNTFVSTVMSGGGNLSGVFPSVTPGPNYAGAKEIVNALIH